MISTLGLFSPRKKLLLRSVLTTSLSTVNSTFLQNSLCSSGLMDSLGNTQKKKQLLQGGEGVGGGGVSPWKRCIVGTDRTDDERR